MLVPDLAGFPAREALRQASGAGLAPSIEGSGLLLRQEPGAGSVVQRGTAIKLVFEPPS